MDSDTSLLLLATFYGPKLAKPKAKQHRTGHEVPAIS